MRRRVTALVAMSASAAVLAGCIPGPVNTAPATATPAPTTPRPVVSTPPPAATTPPPPPPACAAPTDTRRHLPRQP